MKNENGKQTFKQANQSPTRKVAFGGAVGAISAILVWVLNDFDILPGGQDVPGEIASAITTFLTFVVSYLVPPAAADDIVQRDNG